MVDETNWHQSANDDDNDNEEPAPAPKEITYKLPKVQGGPNHAQEHRDRHARLLEYMDAINICDYLADEVLGPIGQKVVQEHKLDDDSRSDWKTKSDKAMKLAMQVAEEKQYPWPKAANIIYPLMTTSAIQFAARAYPAIVAGRSVVKGVVIGDDQGTIAQDPRTGEPVINPQSGKPVMQEQPGAKSIRAELIGEHMSWQLLDEQTEWEEETDKLLHLLPIAGCCFRKTFFDSSKGRNASVLVSAMKVVINYHAKSLETAPRITEEVMLYPLEVTEMERSEVFREVNYSPENSTIDPDAPREFLEQHRLLDLDEDGYPEPYIVTVHKASANVVRIVARFDKDSVHVGSTGEIVKITPIEFYTKYDFLPNPEGGIYGVGFGQLLRPLNEAVNTTLNMLIDAGHMAVVGGGFIGKGLSMHSGNVRFMPGEYKPVNVSGATVRDNIVPLVVPGPSPTLFQLLGTLIEAGKEISAVKDVLTGEQTKSNVPATTTLALIEQGLKTFTAIYKRIHRSLKKELDKLYRLNSIYLPDAGAGYRKGGEWKQVTRQDYVKGQGVEPVSDPSMVSDMQKMGRASFLGSFMNDPHCNPIAIRRRMFDAAAIEKIDELILPAPPPNPELLAKAAELQTREERTKAEAVRDYAQAYLFMTQAAKLVDEAHLNWAQLQLDNIQQKIEAMNGTGSPDEGGPSKGDTDDRLSELETSPSNQGVSSIPKGQGQGPGGAMPGLPPGGAGGGPAGPGSPG